MTRRLCTGCLIVLTAPALAQCSPNKAGQAAAIVRQRQAELLLYKTDGMTTQVPPTVGAQIIHLKDALANTANASMSCASPAEAPTSIQARLAKLLGAKQPEKPFSAPTEKLFGNIYGADLKVAVSTPANAPHLRAVTLNFGIECGDDTILLLYEATSAGWHQLLRWQSPGYNEISGAFGDFFAYTIIPSAQHEELHLAVAHGTPWCSSRWSGFDIDVLAPSHEAPAKVVWHTQRSYSRGDGSPRLRPTTDGFELRINDVTFDTDLYERAVIYRYNLRGEQIQRIAPIAVNGRGFVEEWLKMPWEEAIDQTASIAIQPMKLIHEHLRQANKNSKTYISYTYGPVRSCLTKGRYQVQMNADPGGPQFYTIEEGPTGYIMANYSTTQDEQCSGPDLMKKP